MRNPYIKPCVKITKIQQTNHLLAGSGQLGVTSETLDADQALGKGFFFDEMEPTEADADDSDDWEDFEWEEEEGMY